MANPFKAAPEEVLRYFDAKDTVPTWGWLDFSTPEHVLSYTVAKTAGFDVIEDLRAATHDAIANYRSYGEFVDELEPILRKKGWWGRKVVTTPSGQKDIVQLGSLHRLRTIYWANTSTARAAGEWERIQRTKRGIPFLIYEMSVAEKRRPEHQGWVGIILHVDDTFWLTHYPPNGWLCQCRVRQISRREAEALGYDPETPAPEIEMRKWKNKATGEAMQIPVGLDPGWHTNSGVTRARNVSRFLGDRLSALSVQARRVAVRDIVGSKQFRGLHDGDLPYAGPVDQNPLNIERGRIALPVAMLPDEVQSLMSAKSRTVLFSNADAHKQLKKRVTRDGSGQLVVEDYAQVQEIIENGQLYEDAISDRDFTFQMLVNGKPWAAVLRLTVARDELYLKSYRRIRDEQFGETERLIRMN